MLGDQDVSSQLPILAAISATCHAALHDDSHLYESMSEDKFSLL